MLRIQILFIYSISQYIIGIDTTKTTNFTYLQYISIYYWHRYYKDDKFDLFAVYLDILLASPSAKTTNFIYSGLQII